VREKNLYTFSLFLIGAFMIFGSFFYIEGSLFIEIIPILVLIVVLDLFPIRFLSGDTFSAGIAGILLLLFKYGFPYSVIGILFSVLAYSTKTYLETRRIRWFPFFATVGMYSVCSAVITPFILKASFLPIQLTVLLAAVTFEILNTLLYAGIVKSIAGTPLFHNFRMKMQELIIPVIICVVIIPRFLVVSGPMEMSKEILYVGFFLLFIIYFSRAYTNQALVRQNMSKEFARLLENRISRQMEGHGTRVGIICETVLEEIQYPKRKRNDFIQLSIIHDIGKSLLPSHVFTKRGALTLSEEKEYQSHCEKGANIIRTVLPKSEFGDWILHHHERFDGKGFPSGLKGLEIPLESRILALCNQLDHIMLRHADDQTVYELINEMSGTVLDPSLLAKMSVDTIAGIREMFPDHKKVTVSEAEEEYAVHDDEKSHIGRSLFMNYGSDGRLSGGEEMEAGLSEAVKTLSRHALKEQHGFHENITRGQQTYEVHLDTRKDEVSIFLHDLTPMLNFRNNFNLELLKSYRDIVGALSDEKVSICVTKDELDSALGQQLDTMEVTNKSDIPLCRAFVSGYLANISDNRQKMRINLAVSEGATNLIKHATGGRVSLYEKDDRLQILISDKGSGIPLHELPKTILVSGYSSKKSLGKGFTLMYSSADKLTIHTSAKGTSILLEFNGRGDTIVTGIEQ
jgi:anti-sigma regulatory factor (Ser/Thr protein kinase)